MKLAALYGSPQFGAEWQKCYSALSVALEQRFGRGRVFERSTKFYSDEDVLPTAEIAIILGLREQGWQYLNRCLELGIPTLVVDLGWLRRERDYWQVSPNGLNNAVKKPVSDDRFSNLGLKIMDPRPRGRSLLVIGQLPGDMQHDITSDREMVNWGYSVGKQAIALTGHRVYWRPHPRTTLSTPRPVVTSSTNRTLHEMIKDEGTYAGIVYNSTTGLDLLRLGCNVVALGPRTVYTDIVHTDITGLLKEHPGVEPVHELLSRVAYSQYTSTELSSWDTLAQVLSLHDLLGDL